MNARNFVLLASCRQMAGFSIVEMMISVAIGLFIIAVLFGILVSTSGSSKTNQRISELQTNGRYALEHLKRELRHAGYLGFTQSPELITTAGGISVNNECLSGGAANSFVTNIRQGIWGADSNPYASDCLPASRYLRGDVLVIRHAASQPTPTQDLKDKQLYLRSTYQGGQIFQGRNEPNFSGVPVGNFALQEYVYYIGHDDYDSNVPALRRLSLQGDTMKDEMVVSGIENMQVQYGRVTTDQKTRYYNANEISGLSTEKTRTEWDDVKSVRLWLLARSTKAEHDYSNTQSYEMGDEVYEVNDSYRRQLFTTVVQLRN